MLSLVDSTGLKLRAAGEWLVEKHDAHRRRLWKKLHLGVNGNAGQIVASALTNKYVDAGPSLACSVAQVGPLLEQIKGSLSAFAGDAWFRHGTACTSPRSRRKIATEPLTVPR